ncbi:MAG: hypothetical protein ABS920_07175 [Sporosarcina sp.]
MKRRKRLPDGTFGELENIGSEPTTEEQVAALGFQLAQEKISNIQKDAVINSLGSQVAMLKIEMMQLKGGGE